MLSWTVRLLRGRPPNVERLERRGKAKGLLRALSYEDPVTDTEGRTVDLGSSVRVAAVTALARHDDPVAFEGLVRALDDPEQSVRVAAIRAMRARRGSAATGQLAEIAARWSGSEHALARAEAVDALAEIGDASVPPSIIGELLSRPAELDAADCDVAARLVRASGASAVHLTIDDLIGHLREASAPSRARKLLVALAPESVDPLLDALRDARARHEAALALGSTGDARAVEPLSSIMLSDEDPVVRRAAAWSLGAIRDPAAVEPLLLATRDTEFAVRVEAIDSFEKLGNAGVALAVSAVVAPALEESARKAVEAAYAADHGLGEGEAVDPAGPDPEPEPEPAVEAEAATEPVPEPEPEPEPPSEPAPRPAPTTSANGAAPPPEQPAPNRISAPRLKRLIDRYIGD